MTVSYFKGWDPCLSCLCLKAGTPYLSSCLKAGTPISVVCVWRQWPVSVVCVWRQGPLSQLFVFEGWDPCLRSCLCLKAVTPISFVFEGSDPYLVCVWRQWPLSQEVERKGSVANTTLTPYLCVKVSMSLLCVCVCVCVLDTFTVFFGFSPLVVYCTCVRTQLVLGCILRACNFRRRLINQADLPRPAGVLQHGQRSS